MSVKVGGDSGNKPNRNTGVEAQVLQAPRVLRHQGLSPVSSACLTVFLAHLLLPSLILLVLLNALNDHVVASKVFPLLVSTA